MTKTELIGALNNILNNNVYGLLLTRLVPDDRWNSIRPTVATFKGQQGDLLRIDIAPLCNSLSNPADKKIVTEEFENCLKRASVREGHEVILLYCEETNQFPLYKAQPWFQFARIIRNVVSHKHAGNLRQWPNDLANKGVNQVAWRGRTLDTTMVGSEVDFTIQEALQLLIDQIEFVQTTLA
jgi:hypothetical protein